MQRITYSKIWLNFTFAALNLTFVRGQKAFPVFHAERVIIRLPCGEGQSTMWLGKFGKGMLFSVEQAFVGRDERRAPLKNTCVGRDERQAPPKTPAWEASAFPRRACLTPSPPSSLLLFPEKDGKRERITPVWRLSSSDSDAHWHEIVVGSLSNNDGDGYQNVT